MDLEREVTKGVMKVTKLARLLNPQLPHGMNVYIFNKICSLYIRSWNAERTTSRPLSPSQAAYRSISSKMGDRLRTRSIGCFLFFVLFLFIFQELRIFFSSLFFHTDCGGHESGLGTFLVGSLF